jgi:opacity protein-like surface antigen
VAYDLPMPTGPVKPFIAGSVGMSRVASQRLQMVYLGLPTTFGGETKAQFGYTVGAGLSYKIQDGLAVDLSYQYADLGDIDYPAQTFNTQSIPQTSSGLKGTLKSNEVLVTMRVHF